MNIDDYEEVEYSAEEKAHLHTIKSMVARDHLPSLLSVINTTVFHSLHAAAEEVDRATHTDEYYLRGKEVLRAALVKQGHGESYDTGFLAGLRIAVEAMKDFADEVHGDDGEVDWDDYANQLCEIVSDGKASN